MMMQGCSQGSNTILQGMRLLGRLGRLGGVKSTCEYILQREAVQLSCNHHTLPTHEALHPLSACCTAWCEGAADAHAGAAVG
jgi:hypothetical protein